MLEDIGETEQAEKLAKIAADYRKVILATIDKAMDRSVDPPFLPIALGEETVHDPITGTRLGSYWNLVIPQVLFSGVFPAKSQTAGDILRYIQTRGGLCMGMIRVPIEPRRLGERAEHRRPLHHALRAGPAWSATNPTVRS